MWCGHSHSPVLHGEMAMDGGGLAQKLVGMHKDAVGTDGRGDGGRKARVT